MSPSKPTPENLAKERERDRGRRSYSRALNDRIAKANKLALIELHGGRCLDCKGEFPPYVLDFDHRDPTQKSFGIATKINCKLERLIEEAAKCDLVCANCHRVRTHKRLCKGCESCE